MFNSISKFDIEIRDKRIKQADKCKEAKLIADILGYNLKFEKIIRPRATS